MNSLPDRRADGARTTDPITVVGAGPAGLACAIALARSGRRVAVHEQHRAVGSRFHGDFQGLENWSDERDVLDELAAAGIEASFEHHGITEGTIFDSNGKRHRVKSARPLFYLIRRGVRGGTLDRALLQQAFAAGAQVKFESRVEDVRGASVLAIGPRRADAIAVGYTFETGMSDGCWLAVDKRLAPLGYAYLLVHGGVGTVASCMFTGFKRQAEYVARTVDFFRERADMEMRNPRPFGGFANFRLPRTAVLGGHLVVGEQAGFQDALAGFGMRYALRSGLLAAQSIIQGSDYARLWRRELLPLLRAGITNRFLFNLVGETGRRFAVRRLAGEDPAPFLRRFYRPSALSRSLFPAAWLLYRVPLRDPSCNHVDCRCVWCECQEDDVAPPSPAPREID